MQCPFDARGLRPLDVELNRPDERQPRLVADHPDPLFDEMRTVLSWNNSSDAGVFVTPAVYPAVPLGKPVLRVCMTSELSEEEIHRCAKHSPTELSWALEPE